MTTPQDRAQGLEQRQRDEAIARHFAAHPPVSTPSATHCLDCDDPIPQARREASLGCERCIDCQGAYERE
jgi:phage/conjugal plasmid C-4 type zinc finger TraR family protein